MKASQIQVRQAQAEAASLQKVLTAAEEVAKSALAYVSPNVKAAYDLKIAAAETLISKVATSPPGSCSEDVKAMKTDLAKLTQMLKSQMNSAKRFVM